MDNINQSPQLPFDPLLECLLFFSKHYNKPSSPHALLSGLPLKNHRLTIDTFIRAAARASLSAKVLKTPLQTFKNEFLPAMIILKNESGCIIKDIANDGTATILTANIEGATSLQEKKISLKELATNYSGYAIFISPAHHFDTRTDENEQEKSTQWFWDVMKKAWAVYSEVLIASFLINLFALASPLFIMNVYDRVVPNKSSTTLWVLASGILIVFLFDFLMRNLRAYFIDSSGRNIDVQLSKNIFSHVLDIRMGMRPSSVGTLANTIQAFEAFRDFITSATMSILVDLPFVLLFILMIGFLGGWIVVVPIAAIPIVLFFGLFVQKPLDNMIRKSYRFNAEKQAVLVETLSSIETIKGMHVESFMQHRWEDIVEAATKLSVKLRALATLGINFSLFAQQLAVIVLVIAGVISIQSGNMTIGALVACTILISRALVPVAQMAGLLARYQQCKTSILALDKIMQLPIERPITKPFLYLSKLEGEIEFSNVSFHYPEQPIPALSHISFKIKPKEKVGIIGATGSGKSTIVKLIMKFYEPTDGNILMDHYEQHQLDPAEIRHFIGYVPQDVTLFHGNIKENITFGAPYVDDSAVIRAAQLSTVDTFVATHPEGFNRPVGERGQYLSGGQRQAIVIARALLLDPSVLIVDELSNSMDDKTTSHLIDQLKPAIQHKTLVLVTHKASMLQLVDRLIVLDAGHIVADGPRDEVLKQLSERKIRAANHVAT